MIDKKCLNCRKPFTTRNKAQSFCSRECYGAYIQRPEQLHQNTKYTLCWECANSNNSCSWHRDFTPVDGWKAKPTVYKSGKGTNGEQLYINSYIVYECPNFEKWERIKK